MVSVNPLKYSKKKVDLAGEFLLKGVNSKLSIYDSLDILSNWRASHIYPLQIFRNRLERESQKLDSNSLTAQRLKRVPSIKRKLQRINLKLSQIQDIAGCRVVLSNMSLVNRLYLDKYKHGDLKHEIKKINNYIENPKKNGYRSIHLVYKYKSDKPTKEKFNNLLIEVQIRSRLQHVWATAVETVGLCTSKQMKFGEGDKEWDEFFKLISSAFAKIEGCPLVEGTPVDGKELYLKIKEAERKLRVVEKIKSWTESVKFLDDGLSEKDERKYEIFVLSINLDLGEVEVRSYTKRQEPTALKVYADMEKKIYDKVGYDVVLVETDSIRELKKAYPNYFLDTKAFLKELDKILNKY